MAKKFAYTDLEELKMMSATEAANNLSAQHKLLYTTAEASQILGLKESTLRVYRCEGKGPRYIHTSTENSLCLYPYEELVAWVESLKQKGWK